jgi:DNA-directed RNA polymerase specialized sigma24 family protein
VDRERALDSLASVYARALRLAADGWTDDAIAADLGIDLEAVAGLLQIGGEKLARAMAEDDAPPARG